MLYRTDFYQEDDGLILNRGSIALRNNPGENVLLDEHLIDGDPAIEPVPVVEEELADVALGSLEDLPGVVHLDVQEADVHLVEGNRLQHLQLGALNVEGEVVHRGVAWGEKMKYCRRLGPLSVIFKI